MAKFYTLLFLGAFLACSASLFLLSSAINATSEQVVSRSFDMAERADPMRDLHSDAK